MISIREHPRFATYATPLKPVMRVMRQPVRDDRGLFERVFCRSDLAELLDGREIMQINHSLTVRSGSIRGLHFQRPPHAEQKWVTCIRGRVFDVALDLRVDSPTCGCWHGEILDADQPAYLVIPEGFAHGFQSLRENCEMLYLHSAAHQPTAEGGIYALDPALGIDWPILPDPELMSERDRQLPNWKG